MAYCALFLSRPTICVFRGKIALTLLKERIKRKEKRKDTHNSKEKVALRLYSDVRGMTPLILLQKSSSCYFSFGIVYYSLALLPPEHPWKGQ